MEMLQAENENGPKKEYRRDSAKIRYESTQIENQVDKILMSNWIKVNSNCSFKNRKYFKILKSRVIQYYKSGYLNLRFVTFNLLNAIYEPSKVELYMWKIEILKQAILSKCKCSWKDLYKKKKIPWI